KVSEGCLSVPGKNGVTVRPMSAKVKAYDRFGKSFEFEGVDLKARGLCHEIDHLDGILFPARLAKGERLHNEK
ncbi:MAG: peptide deformylase, partial [Oscillospiraceae bacterium]|nr:peptide deformylase [Oscillospiraceae bacterium]